MFTKINAARNNRSYTIVTKEGDDMQAHVIIASNVNDALGKLKAKIGQANINRVYMGSLTLEQTAVARPSFLNKNINELYAKL